MTETTKTVFEKHEVRKTRAQKTAFLHFVTATAASEGYDCHTEDGYFGAKNIVVGDPETAKVVYTAHYDTCVRLPFPNFITPKNIGIYLLYQIALTILLLGLPTLLVGVLGWLVGEVWPSLHGVLWAYLYFVWYLLLILELWLFMAGPANPHTANDNTSGVTTLLDIMQALPTELRGEVAFIFFDLEEMGLFGSAGYASKHKQVMKNTLLVNFDCVSDGSNLLFLLRKGAKPHAEAIRNAFPSTDTFSVEVLEKGGFYPSDQANFTRGVGVAALKSSKGGILYMDRIHTVKDTAYEEANVAYLTEGAIRLAQALTDPTA